MADTFKLIDRDGNEHTLDIQPGVSVMETVNDQVMINNWGNCGGMMLCASCHCQPDTDVFGSASEEEQETLEDYASSVAENSRLGCQCIITNGMKDFTIKVV